MWARPSTYRLDNSNAYVATNKLSRNAITITGGILCASGGGGAIVRLKIIISYWIKLSLSGFSSINGKGTGVILVCEGVGVIVILDRCGRGRCNNNTGV